MLSSVITFERAKPLYYRPNFLRCYVTLELDKSNSSSVIKEILRRVLSRTRDMRYGKIHVSHVSVCSIFNANDLVYDRKNNKKQASMCNSLICISMCVYPVGPRNFRTILQKYSSYYLVKIKSYCSN